MKWQIIALFLLTLAGLENAHALAQTSPPGAVQISIQQPPADAMVIGSEVRVALATTGSVALSPPSDHEWPTPGLFHVYLDEVDVLQTPLLQFSIQPIAPGPHTLRVTLEGWSGGTASPATGRFTMAPAPAPTMGADESPIYLRSGPPAPMVPGARNPSGILRPITDFLKPPAPPANDPHSSGNGPALPPASPSLLAAVAAAPLPPMPTPPGGTGRTAAATLAASPALRGLESTAQPSYTGNPVLDAQIERSISDSDEYMAHGQLFAATDACFDVIRLAPDFLPIHLRLAEIARLRGKPEDATTKLHSVVDLYLARGESVAASQVYPALINLQPLDVHLRTKLAALLTDLGERDAAVEQYLALSDMLFTTGQHDRALEELRRLQRLAPQNAQVRLQAGTYLLRLDRAEEALGEFSRALQLDPDNQLALVRVYVTLVLLDKETQWDALQTVLAQAQTNAMTREIIGEEVRAQALVTERPALFYTLGLIYEMEHPETAMSAEEVDEFASTRLAAMRGAWEQGLALLHPGDRSVLAVLLRWRAGKMALALHDGAAAVPLYQEVMALLDDPALEPSPRPTLEFIKLPERQHVYLPLAEAYSLNAQPAEAIEALQTAKTHLPYNREIYTKLADLYFRRGQLGAALVAMEELVNHYQETYQTDKMLEALGYMARLAPSNIPVRRKLADIYLKRGMLDQGLAELELLSNLQRKEGLVKDAVQTLQRASDIYLTMGHHTEAYAVYAQIVRMAPGDVDARQQLINLYIQTGRLADAAHEQKDLAEICLAQGMVQPAIAALHQLIALAPQDPYGYYALAEVLASGGEYGQAARLYNRLRRLEPDNPKLGPLQAEMQRLAEAGTRVDSER